jgi:hypothetical protein
LEEDSV